MQYQDEQKYTNPSYSKRIYEMKTSILSKLIVLLVFLNWRDSSWSEAWWMAISLLYKHLFILKLQPTSFIERASISRNSARLGHYWEQLELTIVTSFITELWYQQIEDQKQKMTFKSAIHCYIQVFKSLVACLYALGGTRIGRLHINFGAWNVAPPLQMRKLKPLEGKDYPRSFD